jgi:hypothetical protein
MLQMGQVEIGSMFCAMNSVKLGRILGIDGRVDGWVECWLDMMLFGRSLKGDLM